MTTRALILVAAGRGERAGGPIPKQYRVLNGKPLVQHTLDAVQDYGKFAVVVLVVAPDDARMRYLDGAFMTVEGGSTRTESVRNGLAALREHGVDEVYIHDAARPGVGADILDALAEALETHDGAVPALPVTDALKTPDFEAVDRAQFLRVQTPQAFRYPAIMAAFDALPEGTSAHDDIAVARTAGLSLAFTEGSERNFKVTLPEDFARAEAMLGGRTTVVGSGFDVHRIAPSDGPMWLCGVPIDCGLTLVGHSDADAGLHAITDAVLGALAMGDIGDHFPPSDPQWKGASSDRFLEHALDLAFTSDARVVHIDLTLICERPKVKPHREAMRKRVAEICALPLERVSIKATTTEGLGFTGRREGLAAQATVTLEIAEYGPHP